jgi:hypothetical protein
MELAHMTRRNRTDDEAESPEAKKRKRVEFEHARAESERVRDSARRKMLTIYGLWTVCHDKRCARAKACSGDVETCLRERWRVYISDETRALLSKALQLMNDGLSPHEAVAAVEVDIAQRKKLAAEFDARQAEKQAAPAQPAPAPAPIRRSAPVGHGPRVRGL